MNAEQAKETAEKAKRKRRQRRWPDPGVAIQKAATRGYSHAWCLINSDQRQKLRDDGFRVSNLSILTLVRW